MHNIKKYEAIAMLDLSEDERELLGKCLSSLTNGFASLERIDTENVTPLVTVLDLKNIMREDAAEKFFTRYDLLVNAPEQSDGYFQVPGTIQ